MVSLCLTKVDIIYVLPILHGEHLLLFPFIRSRRQAMGYASIEVSAKDISSENDTARPSLLRRLGWQAAFVLPIALVSILAVAGFLAFLWFAGLESHVWHRLMITGWVTRAVTVSTLILRFSVDLQSGLAGAMLAAMILELNSVRLHDAVKVSMMRASNPQLLDTLSLIPAMCTEGLSLTTIPTCSSTDCPSGILWTD